MVKREFPEGDIPIIIHVSEELNNKLKIGAEKVKKEMSAFICSILFDVDVTDRG